MKTMLKSALLLGLTAAAAQASVLLDETFTYADGALVGQGGWAAHSGANVKPIQVSGGTITLLESSGTGEDVSVRPLLSTPLAATQTIYSSFDVTVSGSSANVYFAHFIRGTTIFDTRIFVTAFSGSDFTFGLGTGSAPLATWATGLTFGQSYNLVASYDFDTGATKLWVNPISDSSTALTVQGTASSAVEGFGFRQASPATESTIVIDNLVLATTFAEATGSAVPEPSSAAALAGLAALAGVALRRRRA